MYVLFFCFFFNPFFCLTVSVDPLPLPVLLELFFIKIKKKNLWPAASKKRGHVSTNANIRLTMEITCVYVFLYVYVCVYNLIMCVLLHNECVKPGDTQYLFYKSSKKIIIFNNNEKIKNCKVNMRESSWNSLLLWLHSRMIYLWNLSWEDKFDTVVIATTRRLIQKKKNLFRAWEIFIRVVKIFNLQWCTMKGYR